WIGKHPDDGRFILSNGYDWTYLTVRDAPYWVQTAAVLPGDRVELSLSDGTEELLDPRSLCVGQDDALYAKVKSGAFEARFSPAAQLALADLLEALPEPDQSRRDQPTPNQPNGAESATQEERIGLRSAGEL